jgi:hypothetical protein
MKDKLVKYNHKAIYYRIKKTLIAFSFVFGAAVIFTIPVSVTLAFKDRDAVAETNKQNQSVSDESALTYPDK